MNRQSRPTAILSVNVSPQPQQKYQKLLKRICKAPPRYQYFMGFIVLIFYMLIVFNMMIGPYAFMNPKFQCNGQPTTQKQACEIIDQCIITNDFTAVYKNELYCDNEPIRTNIQSIFGFGYVIGKLSFPILSDIIGRRKALLLAVFFGIISTCTIMLSIQYNVYSMMLIGNLIAGIFGSGIGILYTIYICDLCPPKIREIYLTYFWTVWGVAEMLFYVFYQYIPQWRFFLTSSVLIPIAFVFILLLFFQVQSPVFALFIKKDIRMFKEIVRGLAKFNKLNEVQIEQINSQGKQIVQILQKQIQTQLHFKKTINRMFCQPKNLKIIICLILINISFVFYYYGMQGSMEGAGLDFGLNMLFVGFTESISYLIAGFVTTKVKRRKGLIFNVILSSAVGFLFLFKFVQTDLVLQTILIIIAKLSTGYVFCFFMLISTSFAFIEGVSQLGRVVGPYVIIYMYNNNLHPIIVFSSAFIFLGTIPTLMVNQSFKPHLKTTYYQVKSQYSAIQKTSSNVQKLAT